MMGRWRYTSGLIIMRHLLRKDTVVSPWQAALRLHICNAGGRR